MNLAKNKKTPGHGFEPRLDDPESPVLPLDDPGMVTNIILSPEKNWSINFYIKSRLNIESAFKC